MSNAITTFIVSQVSVWDHESESVCPLFVTSDAEKVEAVYTLIHKVELFIKSDFIDVSVKVWNRDGEGITSKSFIEFVKSDVEFTDIELSVMDYIDMTSLCSVYPEFIGKYSSEYGHILVQNVEAI